MSTELTTPIKIEIPGIGTIESADLYLKSEVDRVIAHNKYKRCLAMAAWCKNAILGWMGYEKSFSSHQRYIKVMLFTKWHKRWLELAEKFKEAK